MENINQYLESMPFTKVVKDRINNIIELNKIIYDEPILEILVCDYKNSDLSTNYSSLWLFTAKSFVECKNFLTYYDFDITPITEKIDYCSINFEDFNLENSTENSKVNIDIRFNSHIVGSIFATGHNCLHAVKIYKDYIISNLK